MTDNEASEVLNQLARYAPRGLHPIRRLDGRPLVLESGGVLCASITADLEKVDGVVHVEPIRFERTATRDEIAMAFHSACQRWLAWLDREYAATRRCP
jgi:hypothetical protein